MPIAFSVCFSHTVGVALFVLKVFYRSFEELVKVGLLSVTVGKAQCISGVCHSPTSITAIQPYSLHVMSLTYQPSCKAELMDVTKLDLFSDDSIFCFITEPQVVVGVVALRIHGIA